MRFEKLKILSLGYCSSLTDQSIPQLKEIKSLRYIDILAIKLTKDGIEQLPELKSLRYLIQYTQNINNLSFTALVKCHNLQGLSLIGVSVNSETCKIASKLKSLRFLDLGYNYNIKGTDLEYISKPSIP